MSVWPKHVQLQDADVSWALWLNKIKHKNDNSRNRWVCNAVAIFCETLRPFEYNLGGLGP